MTIAEAIQSINTLMPNSYSETEKIDWLSRLDGLVKREIIDTHEGYESVTFDGYTSSTETSTELLVPAPYDEMYIYWLESKINYHNLEYNKYNNSVEMFNTCYKNYANYYNRIHMPLPANIKYFG